MRVIYDGDEATDDPYKLSNAEWLKGQVTPGSSVIDRNGKSINEYRQGLGLSIKAHVNYNQYTFGMITDRISWDSFSRVNEGEAFSSAYQYFVKKTGIFVQTTVNAANFLEYVESGLYTRSGDKASVNFKRGGFYSDIYTYNYDGYDPNTDMMIVGNNNGQATIRAKHISSGQEKYVDVEIETMKDKLFMFSVLPKGETTVTYPTKSGKPVETKTDANGELALYEPDGITSGVFFTSVIDGEDYLCLLTRDRIV